jgi:predicted RNA-binding protein YlqC (UPF0109 family)
VSREVVEYVTEWLVDYPDEVEVTEVEADGGIVLEVAVHPDDVGKVIGKRGRIIRSLRAIAKASGQRQHQNVSVEVVD